MGSLLHKIIARGGTEQLPPYEFTYYPPPTPPGLGGAYLVNDSAYYVTVHKEPRNGWVGWQGWYASNNQMPDNNPYTWLISSPQDAKWWSLSNVKYPSGASITFDYESNVYQVDYAYRGILDVLYDDPQLPAGYAYGLGPRVIQQDVCDGVSTMQFDYSYSTYEIAGAGKTYGTPLALYSASHIDNRYYDMTYLPKDWLFNQAPCQVLYEWVNETQPNGGVVRKRHSIHPEGVDLRFNFDETLSTFLARAYAPRGELLSIDYLLKRPDDSLVVSKREEFIRHDTIRYIYPTASCPKYASIWTDSETVITTIFDEDGRNPVQSSVTRSFNKENGLLAHAKIRMSDGQVRLDETRYVTDYPFTGDPYYINDNFVKSIGLLKDRNAVNAVVERYVQDSATAKTYAAVLTEYGYAPSPKSIHPARIYTLSGDVTDAFVPAFVESDALVYDIAYDTVFSFERYDADSWFSEKILSVKNAAGVPVSYQWGRDAKQLISETQNALPDEAQAWVFEDSTHGFGSSPGTWVLSDGCYQQTNGTTTETWNQATIGGGVSLMNAVVEADVRFDSSGTYRYAAVAKYGSIGSYVRFELRKSEGKVRIQSLENSVGTTLETSRSFNENQWYHVRGDIVGDTARFYLDGELLLTLVHPTVSMGIGYPGLCTFATCASFDNVRFYPPEALMSTWAFEPATLFLKEKSDPTGVRTSFTHDGLGRLLTTSGSEGELLDRNSYTIDGSGTITTTTTAFRAPADSGRKTTLTDGLGKPYLEQIMLGDDEVLSWIHYDEMGRVWKVEKPYYSNSGQDPEWKCGGYAYVETKYLKDATGRVKSVGAPGMAFRIGSGHESLTSYGTNEAGDVSGYSAGTLTKIRNTDENGTNTDSWIDNAGRRIAVSVDPGTSPHLNLQTLFDYDVVGNLVLSTPPRGAGLSSSREYDTRGQVVATVSPDAGRVRIAYNSDGVLRFRQDSVQWAAGKFSYSKYDVLGRVIETGEYTGSFESADPDNAAFPASGTMSAAYLYDRNTGSGSTARYLSGRCARVVSYRSGGADSTFLSYDRFGRIEWTLLRLFGLSTKKIEYHYDWQGGLTKVGYTDLGASENAMYFFYDHDQAGRIAHVYSSQDPTGLNKALEATFTYLPNGQISRLQLGWAQGVDYNYNERDWVAQINHQNLIPSEDPGLDGTNGIPPDQFGMVIGYHNINDIGEGQDAQAQYNGNISWEIHNSAGLTYTGAEGTASLVGNSYRYDAANRLTAANFGYYTTEWKLTSAYDLPEIGYDANGNITTMSRMGVNTTPPLNRFRYDYTGANNRLLAVHDTVTNQTNTYAYDPNGSMVADQFRSVSAVLYDNRNLPTQATIQGTTVRYGYDASGQRTYKEVGASAKTYYIRGADGETIALYDGNDHLLFWNILAGPRVIGKITPF